MIANASSSDLRLWAAFALAKVLLHAPVLGRYGYHHDELYFLACARHLALGYVDHAPLVPWIAWVSQTIFGDSLVALRAFSLAAGALAVALTGLLTSRLGGGRIAQALACASMLTAPVFLRMTAMFTIPAFELPVWILAAIALTRAIEGPPRAWGWVGAAVGVGLLIKPTILLLAAGVAAGLVLTPARSALRSRWPYLAAATALVLWLPNLWWQATHGWPTLEFVRGLRAGAIDTIGPAQFLVGQVLYLNPVTVPVWMAGLVWLLRVGRRTAEACLGLVFVTAGAVLLLVGGKIYYLAPAYPVLFAGGAIAIERWARAQPRPLVPPFFVGLAIGAFVLMPLSLPWLPLPATEGYIERLTFGRMRNVYELTGDLRGQFAWRERVRAVASVWQSLPPHERAVGAVFASGYGTAGAIDVLGPSLGLPAAYSGHMTYHLWGPPPADTQVVVTAGLDPESLRTAYSHVEVALTRDLEWVNPGARRFVVCVARGPLRPIHEMWPDLRRWD